MASSSRLPFVPSTIPRDLRGFLDRLRDILGATGSERLLTPADLASAGLVTIDRTGAMTPVPATSTPTVSDLPSGGTAADYLRGDSTWQPLTPTAVGLGAVDNTADVDKPVSTAQQAAIEGRLGVLWNVRGLTADATAAVGDWCDCDASAGGITVTLPAAGAYAGQALLIGKADSSGNAVTVSGAINGGSSVALTAQYTTLLLASTGTEWRIV